MADRRVQVITGDVGTDGLGLDAADRAMLASCDIVIHSAATVAFDSPLDGAVEINLLGPTRIVATLLNELGVAPHLVVGVDLLRRRQPPGHRARGAGVGRARSTSGSTGASEVAAARRSRADAEAESRTPENAGRAPQGGPRRARRGRRAGAGGQDRAAPRPLGGRPHGGAGRARAVSLGWPDAYAYTKALGEQALLENRGAVPVYIVRPSIIESALTEPRPGWIRGFRMAEPIIISYARGLLKQFPGVPEGTVDVIPVDLVVGAICGVAALGPERGAAHHPGGLGHGQPAEVPLPRRQRAGVVRRPSAVRRARPADRGRECEFAGARARCRRQLKRAKTLLGGHREGAAGAAAAGQAGRAVGPARGAPHRGRAGPRLRRALRQLRRVRGDLLGRPPAGRRRRAGRRRPRATSGFDPRVIDWRHYIRDIHLPTSSSTPASRRRRARAAPRTATEPPAGPGAVAEAPPRGVRPREHPHRVERRRELLVAGHPAAAGGRSGALRGPHAGRGAQPAVARPQGPGRLPALLLPPLRGRSRRPDRRRRGRAVQRPHPHQELPGRASGASASTGPPAIARSSSRARSTSP